jgi:multicomponent Na+:H+ antiporter subunit G
MIGGIILILSATFTLLAAVGLVRMPDLYTKMHAVSKAGAFGGAMLLILAGIIFGLSYFPVVLVNIAFFYFTAPIAAQMIAKSALTRNIKPWEGDDSES